MDGSPATPSAGTHTSGQRLIFQYRSVFWRSTKRIIPQFGILQPLEIEGNTLRDNQIHIALIKGDNSVVRNNRCQGTAPGILPLGLAVSGTNVTIANNQFEDMPEGIRLLGDDPDFGTILGIAVNAQVTSNRFCNVTTHIKSSPSLPPRRQARCLALVSSNALTIAPAVLVSWPVEDDRLDHRVGHERGRTLGCLRRHTLHAVWTPQHRRADRRRESVLPPALRKSNHENVDAVFRLSEVAPALFWRA